jgi:hypothetical protein
MSRTDGNTEKTAGTLENGARPDNLHSDVFVTPGIPIVTRDKPPGVRETFFQATASTLISGQKTGRSAVEGDRPNCLSASHEKRRTQPRVTITRRFEEARDGVIDNLGVSDRAHVAHPVELDDLYFRKRSYEKPSDTSRR